LVVQRSRGLPDQQRRTELVGMAYAWHVWRMTDALRYFTIVCLGITIVASTLTILTLASGMRGMAGKRKVWWERAIRSPRI
jgi:hypothetical protein